MNDATNQLPDLVMEGRWEEALHGGTVTGPTERSRCRVADLEGVIADSPGLTERSEAAPPRLDKWWTPTARSFTG
ncbi:MAG: hypothetical protein R2856_03965 [Caldilineaceae bacterium]